jgi:hypothetical protein
MDFIERLESLSKKLSHISESLETEEATKNALVMPFLHSVLGYDVFDPTEVIPEYTADAGIKKGEKVDYALMRDGEVQILIECKKYGEALKNKHTGQLFRYFSVTHARLAILTNGSVYQFYTDLDAPNRMDEKPFLILDLADLDEHIVPEVKKLTKSSFDLSSILDAAGELKYLNQIKTLIAKQFENPEDDFIRLFTAKVYDGKLTQKVTAQFSEITKKALQQFLNDSINDRLKSAISPELGKISEIKKDLERGNDSEDLSNNESKVVTTEEEIDGFNIVRAILRKKIPVERIASRDTISYFGILLDDNNRKPLCRLHFNTKNKYIGIIDDQRSEVKHQIEKLEDIYNFSDELLKTVGWYESENESNEANIS